MSSGHHASISKVCLTAVLLLAPAASRAQSAQSGSPPAGYTFKVIHEFKGPVDAAYPWAGLVRAKDGNLYGTSWAGGAYANCSGGLGAGCGALFRLDPSGKETVIYSFVGVPGPIHLYGEVLPGPDGSLYGVTNEGGTSTACYNGCGAVFRLDENDKLKVLYNFGTNGGTSDANWPAGELVRDSSGNLYGTSSRGGTNNNGAPFSKSGRTARRLCSTASAGAPMGQDLRRASCSTLPAIFMALRQAGAARAAAERCSSSIPAAR